MFVEFGIGQRPKYWTNHQRIAPELPFQHSKGSELITAPRDHGRKKRIRIDVSAFKPRLIGPQRLVGAMKTQLGDCQVASTDFISGIRLEAAPVISERTIKVAKEKKLLPRHR